jgi:hypothetical protein
MLQHAVLIIADSENKSIGIPVTNFPVLPIGSQVDVYISDDVWFETGIITAYRANNKYGTEINIDLRGLYPEDVDDETLDRMWNSIAKVCVLETENIYELIYPRAIDFEIEFPLPSL